MNRGGPVAITLGIALLAVLALEVRAGPLVFDQPLTDAARGLRDSPIVRVLDIAASLPVWSALVAISAALLWRTAGAHAGILTASALTAELATAAMKAIVARPRPLGADLSDLLASASFPSGHVVRAVVGLGLLAVLLGRLRPSLGVASWVVATLFLVVLAVARVASGEHYPSDVLGGLLLGAVWLRVILVAERRLRGRLSDRARRANAPPS